MKSKMNAVLWGDFPISSLFDIHPTKSYKLTNAFLFDGGDNPVIVNSAYNNGVGGYSSQQNTEKGNMITFSDTVDANTIFYQEQDFIGYPHVQGLYPIGEHKDKWNKNSLKFFATVFRKKALTEGFDYGNKFRRDVAIKFVIPLPIDEKGDPNWYYMEQYIAELEAIVNNSITNLQLAGENRKDIRIDVSKWKDFYLKKLFDVSRPIARSEKKYEEGNTPFVSSGRFNNGITSYREPKSREALDKGNCITVSPVDGYAFYQESDFLGRGGAGSSIMILRNENLNKNNGLFIATIIRAECSYEYNDMGQSDINSDDKTIHLPYKTVNGEDVPDWEYMDDFIKYISNKTSDMLEVLY